MDVYSLRTFHSLKDPGKNFRPLVWSKALLPVLAWCCTPLMVLTLVAVLQGLPVLLYLLIGMPMATVVSWCWTAFRMKADLARVHISDGCVSVQTVWDLLVPSQALVWRPLLDLRVSHDRIYFAAGDTPYELDRADWLHSGEMVQALQAARQHARTIELCPV